VWPKFVDNNFDKFLKIVVNYYYHELLNSQITIIKNYQNS